MSSSRRSRLDYVEVAAEMVRSRGPARSGAVISMADLAQILAVSRSTLYRWWPTATDASEDIALYTATSPAGWESTFLAAPPADGVHAALVAALEHRSTDPAVAARAAVSSWPPTSRARQLMARHEREWISRCASWLRQCPELRGDDRPTDSVPWTDVALALRAVVEGCVFLHTILAPNLATPWTADEAASVADTATSVVEAMAAGLDGLDVALEEPEAADPSPPEWSSGQLRALERIDKMVADSPGSPGVPEPARLVDLDSLARSLGVSARRLYVVWPTAVDVNAAVTVQLIRDQRALVEGLTLDAVSTVLGGSYTRFSDLFVSVFDAIVRGAVAQPSAVFPWTLAMSEASVRAVVAAEFAEWIRVQQVSLLAILQLIHHHLRAETDPSRYVGCVFGAVIGSMRLAIVHPALLDRKVSYKGGSHPTLPVGIDAAFSSFTEPCDHNPAPPDDHHDPEAIRPAPPLPSPGDDS